MAAVFVLIRTDVVMIRGFLPNILMLNMALWQGKTGQPRQLIRQS
jgi:hypothetical protein